MIRLRLQKLWTYNEWAWGEVWPHLAGLAASRPEAYFAERPFFWGSLHGLAAHSFAAEAIWLERLAGSSPSHLPGGVDFDDFESILAVWRPLQIRWRGWLDRLGEGDTGQVISYRTTHGSPHSLPAMDIVQHVVNHATEHRSQMTPVLFQLDAATGPLDYLRFCLEQT